ncbi:hypothetical protein Drorol1_Dr00008616 [Drosera rotundifolia]
MESTSTAAARRKGFLNPHTPQRLSSLTASGPQPFPSLSPSLQYPNHTSDFCVSPQKLNFRYQFELLLTTTTFVEAFYLMKVHSNGLLKLTVLVAVGLVAVVLVTVVLEPCIEDFLVDVSCYLLLKLMSSMFLVIC